MSEMNGADAGVGIASPGGGEACPAPSVDEDARPFDADLVDVLKQSAREGHAWSMAVLPEIEACGWCLTDGQRGTLEVLRFERKKARADMPKLGRKWLFGLAGMALGGALAGKLADGLDAMKAREAALVDRMAQAIYENDGVLHVGGYTALSADERAPYLAMAKAARDAMPEPKPVPPPLVFNDAYNLKALLEADGDRFTDQASVDQIENLLADLHQGAGPGIGTEEELLVAFFKAHEGHVVVVVDGYGHESRDGQCIDGPAE